MAVAASAANSDAAQFTGANPQMIAALGQLLPTLFGSRTNTTSAVSSNISPQASGMTDAVMAAILPQITGTAQADGVVQNILTRAMQQTPGVLAGANQGGYNSTISQLLMQDLIARATGEASGAVLQSQQQAAQTAAQLTAATQQNTRQQTSSQQQRTPGQGLNLGSVLAGVNLLQRGRRALQDMETRRAAGRTVGASTSALSSLPASAFSSLGSAGPVANAFGPTLGGTSGLGATFAAGFSPDLFSLESALGLDGGVGSSFFSSFAADAGAGIGADALSGIDGVFSGADLLDVASGLGTDIAVDAATDFAVDAGAELLGDFGADVFAEGFGETASSFAFDSFGVPYFTLARLGASTLADSDIPIISDIAGPVDDVLSGASDFIGEAVDVAGGFFDVFDPITEAVGTVICTHMYSTGMINEFEYQHTVAARAAMPEVIRNGYRYWAIPLVKHMEQQPLSLRSRITYALARGYIRKLVDHQHNAKSLFVYGVGVPLCGAIGLVLRALGKTVPRNRAEAEGVR